MKDSGFVFFAYGSFVAVSDHIIYQEEDGTCRSELGSMGVFQLHPKVRRKYDIILFKYIYKNVDFIRTQLCNYVYFQLELKIYCRKCVSGNDNEYNCMSVNKQQKLIFFFCAPAKTSSDIYYLQRNRKIDGLNLKRPKTYKALIVYLRCCVYLSHIGGGNAEAHKNCAINKVSCALLKSIFALGTMTQLMRY